LNIKITTLALSKVYRARSDLHRSCVRVCVRVQGVWFI